MREFIEEETGCRGGHPRLVMLSACATGLHQILGIPEESVGLPGAFLTVGAAAVVATLWPVNDIATALLTVRFYDLHLSQKLPPATALRRGQLWLRDATRADLATYIEGRLGPAEARWFEQALAGTAAEAPEPEDDVPEAANGGHRFRMLVRPSAALGRIRPRGTLTPKCNIDPAAKETERQRKETHLADVLLREPSRSGNGMVRPCSCPTGE